MTTSEELQAAFRYLWPDELQALKQLAQSLPDNPVVVNIGAGAGTSGLAFMESRPDLRLMTVDIQKEDSPLGCLQAEFNALKEAGFGPDMYHARNVQICMDSKNLGLSWALPSGFHRGIGYNEPGLWGEAKDKIDMVFVDGDHTYEGCSGDILAWLPNIKPGGIIAVHDYRKSELYAHEEDYRDDAPHPLPFPGLDKAVDELLMGKYELILRVKSLVAFRVTE